MPMVRSDVLCCPTCGLTLQVGQLPAGARADCPRCGSRVSETPRGSLHLTAAFALAALILYVPANLYPILRMHMYGAYSESTVWDGVVSLAQANQWGVAVIVFMASLVIPIFKLLGLLYLVLSTSLGLRSRMKERTRVYRFIDAIGPWSMLDVFLLAVLVALVKLGSIATVLPGPGLVAFALVVVFNMLATQSFDPRMIWAPKA
jgi:paraquat-inducible protein A